MTRPGEERTGTNRRHRETAARGGADPISMNVFHAALLRDFARARLLLTRPGALTRRRAVRLGRHLLWLLAALEIHHQGEDQQLWPLLAAREPSSKPVLDAMLAEHHSIDLPMRRLHRAAVTLAAGRAAEADERAEVLAAIEELVPPLRAHLQHEEDDALPVVRRMLTEVDWAHFERSAWASRRSLVDTLRFVPWLLDGIRWTPALRSRFAPARRLPRWALRAASAVSRVPAATVWAGTAAADLPSPLSD